MSNVIAKGISSKLSDSEKQTIRDNLGLGSNIVTKTDNQALHDTDALRISGSTLYLYKGDGGNESVSLPISDPTTTQIGVNQTWQNFTGSRSSGVTYTNTTGKPIVVSVWGNFRNNNWVAYTTVNGVVCNYLRDGTNYNGGVMTTAIVPTGQTYKVNISGITGWAELR